MWNFMFQSHYLLYSTHVSSNQANQMIVIHIPWLLLLCVCIWVVRRHTKLNALLHTSQV